MNDFVTTEKLKELEIKARGGSARQRAEYVQAQKKHDEAVQVFFKDADITFLTAPLESEVEELKQEHESNPDDINAKARYMMIKAQFDVSQREAINQKHVDFRLKRQQVRDAAANVDVKATPALLEQARQVAAENPTTENRAAYAIIKRRLENSGE